MKKVSIIGGGIAGISIAIAFQKHGLEVEVYEAATELKPVGAGITLAFNAMKAAQKLGFRQEVLKAGRSMENAMILNDQAKVLTAFNYRKHLDKLGDLSIAIHRADLHQILLGQLKGDILHLNKKAQSFTQDKDGVMVSFEDGSTLETPLLIVSDGIHSIFRQALIPNSKPQYAGYTCWRGIGELPEGYAFSNSVVECWGKGARIGIVPTTDKQVYWFAVKNAPENDPSMKNAEKQDILNMFKSWSPKLLKVIENTPEDQIIWNDIVDIDPIDRFAFGNILLTGDAAHATTPNMGQGGCQAFEDAAVLDALLAFEKPMNQIFQEFEKLRVTKTSKVISQSRTIGKLAQWENPILAGIRNFGMSLTPESTNLKQIMWLNDLAF